MDFSELWEKFLNQAFNIILSPVFQLLEVENLESKDRENKRKGRGGKKNEKAASIVD